MGKGKIASKSSNLRIAHNQRIRRDAVNDVLASIVNAPARKKIGMK